MSGITERLKTAIADRYVIERELGQGGMATVYLAHDVKHDRKVALKVLRPELAAVIGAERFLQEIKVTANLQHPNILPLFDSGEADSFLYYVMPYIEGESLRDKLAREKQLSIEQAVDISADVAAALDYAHRHGVIHRDIKPENVLIHDGKPLVADFGIALAVSQAGGTRLTDTGLSIGTPHYMSPEQAMGDRELDARSDVYSLGAMLYEMLTGDPPYTGSTAQAIVAKVITEKAPPVTAIRDTVPGHVGAAVGKALSKLPADRFGSAAQFAEALRTPGYVPPAATREAPAGGAPPRRVVALPVAVGLAVVAVAAMVVAAFGWLRPPAAQQVARFSLALSGEVPLRTAGAGRSLAISPDGKRFVFVGADQRLYVRELNQLGSRELPTTANHSPFFSPDGEWVAYLDQPFLRKVALAGGPPLTIAEDIQAIRGGSWGPDDVIVFTPNTSSPLLTVAAGGGPIDTLTRLDLDRGETSHRWPEILPGNRGIVFSIFHSGLEDSQLAVLVRETGDIRRLLPGLDPHYVATGHLVYVSSTGALLAVPFDLDRLEVTGSPVSLTEGILVKSQAVGEYAISRNGTLIYVTGEGATVGLQLVDSLGRAETLVERVPGGYAPRFSPDGRRVALRGAQEGSNEIWVYDFGQNILSRLTFEGSTDYPVWSPTGDTILYTSAAEGDRNIRARASDGSGEAVTFLDRPNPQWEIEIARTGGHALVREISPSTGHDLIVLTPGSTGEPATYLQTQFNERAFTLAPDGRWAAYVSNESGRDEVFVRAFPVPSGRWQVSGSGGQEPHWALDGRTIYYRNLDSVIAAEVRTAPTFGVGRRRLMFTGNFQTNTNHPNYDRNRRGEFVMMGTVESATTEVIIVLNWFEEIRQRMGGR